LVAAVEQMGLVDKMSHICTDCDHNLLTGLLSGSNAKFRLLVVSPVDAELSMI
jgi:hypothetical protein